MTFWEHFFRLVWYKPRPAVAALYWHLTRRKVRARNRLRVASADLPFAYAMWIKENERASDPQGSWESLAKNLSRPTRFTILIYSRAENEDTGQSIRSVQRQIYPQWDLIVIGAEPLNRAVAEATGDFIVPLRAGDLLSESALLRFVEALQKDSDATILYGDEDRLSPLGTRCRPWFKPQWNHELFLAQDYLSSAAAIEIGLAREACTRGSADLSALLVTVTSASRRIVHIPHILVHVASADSGDPQRIEAVRRALEPHGAKCVSGPYESVKVEWPLPSTLPLVSLIIPTKDKVDLLRPCIGTLLERTVYANFEILIVDNASADPRAKEFLVKIGYNPRIRVLSYDRPFNYSAINNFAVRHAGGSYLCLLNNDTEVIEGAWLTELMRYAVRPEIGAVGAKLLYDDGSIQHAGVVVGIGEAAGHAHRFLSAGERGYFAMPHLPQFVSAVTGACLVVEKSKFELVGGLDEDALPVAFNDVDLCMKLKAAGWNNVYVPHAVLIHHESKSRGSDFAAAHLMRYRRELKVLQERWGTKNYADPLHNPNLDRYSETFVLRV